MLSRMTYFSQTTPSYSLTAKIPTLSQQVQRAHNLLLQMKTVVFIKSGVQEVQRAQNRQFCMENSCFYKIRVLGCSGSLKSAIFDGKQLFLLNQVFRRSRQLIIGFFRWETAVFIKSGVQEVQRAQNRQFQMENSCFYKIRFLAGSRKLKIGNFGW